MKKGNEMKKGFTLIELITVVIIIAILSGLALPQYTKFIERTQASTAKEALSMIRKSQAIYFALNSGYSGNLTNLVNDTPEVSKLNTSLDWQYNTTCAAPCADFTSTASRRKGVFTGAYMNMTSNATITIYQGTATTNPTGTW